MTTLPENAPDAVTRFLALSVVLTGYEDWELLGTGMIEGYYREVLKIIGARELGALLAAFDRVDGNDADAFRRAILDDERYGPVARNVVMMWYLGTWSQLSRDWRNTHGATFYDTDHVVSAAAYREGLVWPAAGTHPMSAKQPGFGSWAHPPTLRGPE